MLVLQCELLEARWQESDGVAGAKDLDRYGRTIGHLRRLLETLGLGDVPIKEIPFFGEP
jgi:hypothetical protein